MEVFKISYKSNVAYGILTYVPISKARQELHILQYILTDDGNKK